MAPKNHHLITACLAAALLISCGSTESGDNHGLGWDYDERGPTGTRVRRVEGAPALSLLEGIFVVVRDCVADHFGAGMLNAPGPLIIFPESLEGHATEAANAAAAIYLDTGTVLIKRASLGDAFSVRASMAHESVHWITHYHGFLTPAQQSAHQPDRVFIDCTAAGARS